MQKNIRQRLTFSVKLIQRQVYDVERETGERSIHRRTFATKTRLALQYLLTGTIPHDRTIEYTIVSAIEASGKTAGHSFKIFYPAKNGFQLTDDSASKLKIELVLDDANVHFMYMSLLDNDVEKATNVCSLHTGHERQEDQP